MADVHPIAATGFNLQVDDYADKRPTYPSVALAQIKELTPDTANARILDLAAGTGIMTKLLVENAKYQHVTAIEPAEGMRTKLKSLLPQVPALDGTSWSIPLDDGSQDMVIIAQAFHWFADIESLREIHRVLKPGGHLVLIWNMESGGRSSWVRALRNCYERFDKGVPQYRKGQWKGVFETQEAAALYNLPYEQRMYENDMLANKDHICRRVMTKSYVASQTDTTRQELQKELEAILDNPKNGFNPNSDGYVNYPCDTELVWMQKKSA